MSALHHSQNVPAMSIPGCGVAMAKRKYSLYFTNNGTHINLSSTNKHVRCKCLRYSHINEIPRFIQSHNIITRHLFLLKL